MRAAVLINDSSGAAGPGRKAVEASFVDAGVEASVQAFGPGSFAEQIRAAAAGVDAVVVGGGDGTIRAAAEALEGTTTPLGVLPMGTFNHFARGMGIPTDLDAAIRTIATGEARAISAGRIGGRLFLNNAALGMAPDVVVRRHESHGSILGRALATVPVALGVLLRLRRMRLTASFPSRTVAVETPFVFVTPNAYAPSLFRFAVTGRRADGQLNVFLATPDSPLDAVRMAFHVLRGHLDRHLDASVEDRVTLASRRDRLRVLIDGEVIRLPPPLLIEGVAEALRVFVPRADAPADA